MATRYVKNITCPNCRYKNVAGTKYCGDCGASLSKNPVLCGKCKSENLPGTKFCGNCGNNLQNPLENDPDIQHLQDALRGKYTIIRSLGEGGFGRVFLGEHIGLGQNHVIKLLSIDSSRNTDIRNRFFQEAQIIARLKHPNIVPIMDVAEYLGRPYYIMSYINGGSLYELLNKKGKISIDKALEIIIKLLTALSEVHRKGIIHRDIKPDNVLLDELGEPILIDFGIARMEEGSKAKTGTGFSIGTPAYMSPEQLDGNVVNHQTDLYSIGILLFELITGNPPYEGNLSSIIKQQQSEEFPSIGTDTNLKLDFIKDIDIAIKKACNKNLNKRFESAEKMRETLDNLSFRFSEEKLNEYIKTNQNEAKSSVSHNLDDNVSEDWKQYEKDEEKSDSKHFQNNIKKIGLSFSLVFLFIFFIYFQFVRSSAKNNEITNEKINNSNATIEITSTAENPSDSSIKLEEIKSSTYINSIGMEFVLIPTGEFQMGCSKNDNECLKNEKPAHLEKVHNPFYIGKYEVLQSEWIEVMRNNPSFNNSCGGNCPVESVSWNDIQIYIINLCKIEKMIPCKYRLPTEVEWEYVARGNSNKKYYWGNSNNDEYLWYDENSEGNIHLVGQKKPNSFGIYDISGNVWEWINDNYSSNYNVKEDINDLGSEVGERKKVLRGCSSLNSIRFCRMSYRYSDMPNTKNKLIGFRLVYIP